jgi:hypothetical protein
MFATGRISVSRPALELRVRSIVNYSCCELVIAREDQPSTMPPEAAAPMEKDPAEDPRAEGYTATGGT